MHLLRFERINKIPCVDRCRTDSEIKQRSNQCNRLGIFGDIDDIVNSITSLHCWWVNIHVLCRRNSILETLICTAFTAKKDKLLSTCGERFYQSAICRKHVSYTPTHCAIAIHPPATHEIRASEKHTYVTRTSTFASNYACASCFIDRRTNAILSRPLPLLQARYC